MKKSPKTKPTDYWSSPEYFYRLIREEFNPQIDVCANLFNTKCFHFFTEQMNALQLDWIKEAEALGVEPIFWCNPPYSRCEPWVKLCKEVGDRGGIAIMLLPSSTDTIWFHDYILPRGTWRPIKGRIRFDAPPGLKVSGPRAGNQVAIFGHRDQYQKRYIVTEKTAVLKLVMSDAEYMVAEFERRDYERRRAC